MLATRLYTTHNHTGRCNEKVSLLVFYLYICNNLIIVTEPQCLFETVLITQQHKHFKTKWRAWTRLLGVKQSDRTTTGRKKINQRHPIIRVCSLLIQWNHADGPGQLSKVRLKGKIIRMWLILINTSWSSYFEANHAGDIMQELELRLTLISEVAFKSNTTNVLKDLSALSNWEIRCDCFPQC